MKERIIDVHTHCGIDYCNFYRGRYPLGLSAVQLSEISQSNGIDYIVTFPMSQTIYYDQYFFSRERKLLKTNNDACMFPFYLENEYLISEINHFEFNNIIPFCSFSLHEEVERQIEYLWNKVENGKIFGLKYHPFYDSENIMKIEKYPEFVELIEKFDLPLICHSGADVNSNPNWALKFAENHPAVRVNIAHMAGFNRRIEISKQKCEKNVYYDISPCYSMCERMNGNIDDSIIKINFSNPKDVFEYAYEMFPDNLLWGTDYPWTYSAKLLRDNKTYYSYTNEVELLKKMGTQIVNKVAWKNVISFLGPRVVESFKMEN